MKDTYEYYKLVKNAIQLDDVLLHSMNVTRLDGNDDSLSANFQRSAKNLEPADNTKRVEIFLKTHLFFESNGPFDIEIIFRGICSSIKEDITQDELFKFSNEQVVSLLLPYARECVTNVLSRMQLPLFYLPTMDVLGSIEENNDEQQLGEMHGDK